MCDGKHVTKHSNANPAKSSTTYFLPVFRNSSIVYAIILEFYNRLYSTGYYTKTPNRINYLSVDKITQFKQSILYPYKINMQLQQLYPSANVLTNMLTSISNNCLSTPIINNTNDVYTMKIFVSYTQYISFFNTPTKVFASEIVMVLIYNLFQDTLGKLNYNGKLITPSNPIFKPVTEDNINIIAATMSDTELQYTTVKTVDDISKNDGFFFTVATVDLIVDKWSPMLLAYFTTKIPNMSFSPSLCNMIYQNNGTNPMIVPNICLTQDCSNSSESAECMDDIKKYCGFRYTPPLFIGIIPDGILVNSNNINCKCYTTGLLPVSQIGKEDSEKAAMCFTTDCNNTQLDNYGISLIDCKRGCDSVNEWVTTSNPIMKSQRPSLLNKDKFDAICGKDYKSPYFTKKINKYVIIVGVIIKIIFSIELWHTTLKLGIKIFILLVVIFMFVYLSIDLAGQGMCDQSNDKINNICQSRLTKINIPTEFCEGPDLPCECIKNCPNNCSCIDSVCYPPSLNRPTVIEKYRKIHIIGIIIGIIGVIIGISLVLTYHVNNKLKIIISILSIIPLIYYIINSFIPISRTVYSGQCGQK